MTRKDYVAIARAFHECKPLDNGTGAVFAAERQKWDECVAVVAEVFAADNARFERLRFVAACAKGI